MSKQCRPEKLLKELNALRKTNAAVIGGQLPGANSAGDAFDTASDIIESLGRCLSWKHHKLVARWKIHELARELNGNLSRAFEAGGRRRSDALKWNEFIAQAGEWNFDLAMSPEATALRNDSAAPGQHGKNSE